MRYEVVRSTDRLHPQVWVHRDSHAWLTTRISIDEAEVIVFALNAVTDGLELRAYKANEDRIYNGSIAKGS